MSSTRSRKNPGTVSRLQKLSSTSSRNASAKHAETTSGRQAINGVTFETGSGNVFADMGLPDADELLLKAQIMQAINSEIKRRGLTQAAAGKLVGLAQPDLSRIATGRDPRFSTERLFAVLRNLGCDVEIIVSQASGPIGVLRLRDLARVNGVSPHS